MMKSELFDSNDDQSKQLIELGFKAAEAGALATKEMTAMAGRSTYLNQESIKSHEDPGARAAVVWIKALNDAM
jgi:hypothetical protein